MSRSSSTHDPLLRCHSFIEIPYDHSAKDKESPRDHEYYSLLKIMRTFSGLTNTFTHTKKNGHSKRGRGAIQVEASRDSLNAPTTTQEEDANHIAASLGISAQHLLKCFPCARPLSQNLKVGRSRSWLHNNFAPIIKKIWLAFSVEVSLLKLPYDTPKNHASDAFIFGGRKMLGSGDTVPVSVPASVPHAFQPTEFLVVWEASLLAPLLVFYEHHWFRDKEDAGLRHLGRRERLWVEDALMKALKCIWLYVKVKKN